MEIGKALKKIRKLKGISQKEVAELTGISAISISQIEQGKTMPRNETVKAVCEALSVPRSYVAFFALDLSDLPPSKKELISDLEGMIKTIVENEIKNSQ